jgi:threonine aldolase
MTDNQSPCPFNSIDLRSDTVTQPSPEMRKAIARAPVGDDQFGEDPTINLLQERVASILGKESSLWFPSGTMTNQVALKTLTNPGDDVIVSRESHAVWYEKGAGAVNSGVQFTEIGKKGIFSVEEFLSAIKPQNHLLYPPTTLVEIENTHNRSGGIIFPQDEIEKICITAREHNIMSYLDGARLWNAAVASNKTPAEIAIPFDLVGVALSKGLGAPGGSLIAGPKNLIEKAMRYRRMFGGAMTQVGIFAAAGLYALEHNMEKLHEDHSNAKIIANKLSESKRVNIDPSLVQTNIIVFNLSDDAPEASAVVEMAKERGVLIFAFGKKTIRVVTHLDVSHKECEQAAKILFDIIEENN